MDLGISMDKSQLQKIADIIIAFRRENGLSQAAFSALTGINTVTISKLERCDANPEFSTLKKIADAVGISVAELQAGVKVYAASEDGATLGFKSKLTKRPIPARFEQAEALRWALDNAPHSLDEEHWMNCFRSSSTLRREILLGLISDEGVFQSYSERLARKLSPEAYQAYLQARKNIRRTQES